MRTYHRLLAFIAFAALLYVGVTGSLIQTLDLATLLRHAPEDDATMQSMNEGIYGNPQYQVLQAADFAASALPPHLDYDAALRTVMNAARIRSLEPPRFVELRMIGGRPVGVVLFRQVASNLQVAAFDAATGQPAVAPRQSEDTLPTSLRQQVKELHRFWSHRDVPGVWFELVLGLAMTVMLVTGLVIYGRLLAARARLGRRNPLWLSGGWWRSLHRVVSVLSAVFLLAIALSGTWLGFESVYHTFIQAGPADVSAPLGAEEVEPMAAATLKSFSVGNRDTPIKVIRLRVYGSMKQGVIVAGAMPTRQLVYNTDTGRPVTLTEKNYPVSGFPFGTRTHEWVKHFHSGYLFGITARWMGLFAGLSLVFLAGSGIVVYVNMWLRRRQLGQTDAVWS